MARDYRHGHQPKESFQRKSQRSSQQTSGYASAPRSGRNEASSYDKAKHPSIKPVLPSSRTLNSSHQSMDAHAHQPAPRRSAAVVWGASFLVSLLSLSGFFVAQHFADFGVKSGAPIEPTIYQEQAQSVNVTEAPSKQAVLAKPDEGLVVQAVKIEQAVPVNVKAQDLLQAEQASESPLLLNPAEAPSVENSSSTQESAQANESSGKNHFSFYQDLSQTEVVVDAVPISVKLSDPYFIQGGTFDTVEKARNEQKRLAQHGLNLVIAKFESQKGIYYRLRMGPYRDRLEMNKKRNELRRLGVDTLLIKMPK